MSKNLNVFDDNIPFLVNVLRDDDHITVRTFGVASPDVAKTLSSETKLIGDAVHDYLWGLGQVQTPAPWSAQLSMFKAQPWFESEATTNLDAGHIVIQQDSLTIERDKSILGANDSDGAVWFFSANEQGKLRVQNLTLATLAGRESQRLYLAQARVVPIFMLMQKYAKTKWSEADTILFNGAYFRQAWHNLGKFDDAMAMALYRKDPAAYQPKYDLRPALVSSGKEIAEVLVRAYDCDKLDETVSSTLYLEAISGYLPKTRVTFEKGKAMFRVMPLGLVRGDKMRVKGGWRNVPGLFDFEIEVP